MNRFKKEVRKAGVRLECDYECMPCNGIDTVECDASKALVREYHYCAGWINIEFNRDMSFKVWSK